MTVVGAFFLGLLGHGLFDVLMLALAFTAGKKYKPKCHQHKNHLQSNAVKTATDYLAATRLDNAHPHGMGGERLHTRKLLVAVLREIGVQFPV